MKTKYWILIALSMIILTSCSVSKPTVKQFVVTEIHDGFFAAKNGKTVLLFGIQDSVWLGKIIPVSIGHKK